MRRNQRDDSQYDQLQAAELFCPRCGGPQPVRQHLLLVLPTGNRYEYRCARCGESVGAKSDDDTSTFAETLRLQ